VAKVEFHCGELFPRVGFIVTNLSLPSRTVMRFYHKRVGAEDFRHDGLPPSKVQKNPRWIFSGDNQ
jgi:hypothetical protein